ncbi:XdhC family protein [Thioclava sp. F36-7]|uniref:XdhC family protein n=1 Tax=Thioclava sp. F36-7 TaxID=1915317 RepID=UPI000997F4EC|nr:XdhC family protein [Thioclava sp. F36-7]
MSFVARRRGDFGTPIRVRDMQRNGHLSKRVNGMDQSTTVLCETEWPLARFLGPGPMCLCFISHVEGPSYRPLGSGMAVDGAGRRFGNLSSGCIDEDVALHAVEALKTGAPTVLRYGRGSPFMDIQLPCGGGLEVTLLPAPDREVLDVVHRRLVARENATLTVLPDGQIENGATRGGLTMTLRPKVRVLVFGDGPEPRGFSALAQAAKLPVTLYAGAEETRDGIAGACAFSGKTWPDTAHVDYRTAVTLFFHDHERETALLTHALETRAFYIGAQGSLRARQLREAALSAAGVEDAGIARLVEPFGYVAHARSAQEMAAGVLAQVIDHARRV